ncbi:hypothetical protein BCM0060_0553 [Bacillus cereus]|nr:hypothetical protein BCM0060_0553 [Bacillus cereus]
MYYVDIESLEKDTPFVQFSEKSERVIINIELHFNPINNSFYESLLVKINYGGFYRKVKVND